MKLSKLAGVTSEIWQVFIQDASSTTGAGLTGLVFNTASLTAYYHRDTDTTATAMTLVTMTVGTFTSLGFKEIDPTNLPGFYQICPPNAAIAAGAKSCIFMLKGATNMAPLPIEVQLDPIPADVRTLLGTAWLTPGTAGTPDVNVKLWNGLTTVALPLIPTTAGRTLDVSATGEAGVDWANVGSPTTTLNLSGTTVKTATDIASQVGAPVGASISADVAAVQADTDNIQTRIPAALVGGRIDANVGAISSDATAADNAEAFFDGTGYAGTNNVIPLVTVTTTATTAGALGTTAKSDVNAEVLDVINVDTFAEPAQGAPAATTTLQNKIAFLYKFLRNKLTQDATTLRVYDDAGTTVDHKSTVSDSGTLYTRGEIGTGP